MNRLVSLALIVVVFVATSATAFHVGTASSRVVSHKQQLSFPTKSSSASTLSSASTTALSLRIKVDPEEKEERLNPAVFKNALYLGSVAFAVLLPVFLLLAGSK